jgi:hypothetical protein
VKSTFTADLLGITGFKGYSFFTMEDFLASITENGTHILKPINNLDQCPRTHPVSGRDLAVHDGA